MTSNQQIAKKHLVLDSKLDFNEHKNNKISKCNKFIGMSRHRQEEFLILSRNSLLTIYKTFVRLILSYTDVSQTSH